ncbi:MAG: hypothetical protein RLZZ347_703 [Candidatus Parcubacteria bacterium]|jgi:hypothetical protein
MTIDLSLKNTALYQGCEIQEVAGRQNLVTPAADAVNIVGRNANALVTSVPREDRGEVELTGPMAVWSYLVVFHAVVHAFSKVYYNDGRNKVLVAAHGA